MSEDKPMDPAMREVVSMLAEMRATLVVHYRLLLMIAKDRLADRKMSKETLARLESLEHQVALISKRPEIPDWAPSLPPPPPPPPQHHHGLPPMRAKTASSPEIEELQKDLAEIEEKVKEEEKRRFDSGIWWKRQRWLWFGIAATILIGSLMTACVGFAANRLQAIEKKLEDKH